MNTLDGILLVDKPQGLTSHDVVARLRRKLGQRQIGHAGTLDPMATGLLVILLGKATKLSQFLMSASKTYEATLKLGETTDSQDADGEITATHPIPADVNEEKLKAIAQGFLGDQYQTPPMYSAKKINGTPLYKLARKGQTIEREPRFIHVASFEVTRIALPELDFTTHCSKGTYVRTLAHDFGTKAGCGAHLTALRRTKSGDLSIESAHTLTAIEEASLAQIRTWCIPGYKAVPSPII